MNGITLTEVKQSDARRGREIVRIGFLDQSANRKPSSHTLNQLFIELWGRLEHASFWMSVVASRKDEMGDATRREFDKFAQFLDVDALYANMKRLLAEAARNEEHIENQLRTCLAEMMAENAELRCELRELRTEGKVPLEEG